MSESKIQTIFRTIKDANNPFVMMDRRPLENKELSYGAKGVLGYILSRPNDWKVRLQDLINRSPDGVYKIRGYIRELMKAGHMRRVEHRDPTTKRITEYTLEVYELPFTSKPLTNLPQAGNLQAGNLTRTNTDLTDTELREIYTALETLTGGLNSNTPKFVDVWLEKHTEEWILKAIGIAKEKKARSMKYIDEILIGWEANGYPKTREQRVQEKKKTPAAQPQFNEDEGAAWDKKYAEIRRKADEANARKKAQVTV